jgi:hypothetical protein
LIDEAQLDIPAALLAQSGCGNAQPAQVAVVTDNGAFDPLLAKLLVRIGERDGIDVMTLSSTALASEVVDQIKASRAEVARHWNLGRQASCGTWPSAFGLHGRHFATSSSGTALRSGQSGHWQPWRANAV